MSLKMLATGYFSSACFNISSSDIIIFKLVPSVHVLSKLHGKINMIFEAYPQLSEDSAQVEETHSVARPRKPCFAK
jgi:hypothetical protein